ncbi:MAG: low molecular weight protein arginine phosphatase [Desulfotomaculaceae bacterium]|nr:low molecular weight protein arginine phosphatase [Desulfotomaculaceae bacterium]
MDIKGVISIKILFVCTGNTCRSCMAEALAGRLLEDKFGTGGNIKVSSAGLAAAPEEPASPFAIEAVAWKGIDMSDHRSTMLTAKKMREADLILTMTRGHREQVNSFYSGHEERVFTLADFAGHGGDVPDPLGQTLETYRECARKLEEMIIRALAKLD